MKKDINQITKLQDLFIRHKVFMFFWFDFNLNFGLFIRKYRNLLLQGEFQIHHIKENISDFMSAQIWCRPPGSHLDKTNALNRV